MDDPFKSILSHFNDREAILEHWRDEGFLITRSDRHGFQRKGKICSQVPPCYCYTFLFEDAANLKDYLEKTDEITLQDLVDEDKEYHLNNTPLEKIKITKYDGKKYVIVVDDSKRKELTGHFPHDLSSNNQSNISDNSVTDIPELHPLEGDDSEDIEKIFNDEGSNND